MEWLWGAIGGFAVGVVAMFTAIEKGRELATVIYQAIWLRWRPWRFEVYTDWLRSGQFTEHLTAEKNYRPEKPFGLHNRGTTDAVAVKLKLTQKGGGSGGNTFDVVSADEIKPIQLPPDNSRWDGLVTWTDARGIHTQRVRTPKWEVDSYLN
ncbi:hypothetical protein [Leifsonia sp. fls2-241-R2A-40a]|uniref:hypothetical protein n=1 Tax=Leifsonia sp. fls2-241-R2A-40a TaxID=3040290 RepID=UPI002551C2AA|nr:hypothetical protein [Leifsonia sp. fls2-241-R2A-40a]